MHQSTKTYGHDVGLSACFRQWRADSHCRFLHGYALAVSMTFQAPTLDHRHWVVDFGALKPVKEWLQKAFDHKLLVAKDDPHLSALEELQRLGLAQIVVLPATGCEAFAEHIYASVERWLSVAGFAPRVELVSVEVREHGANSALFVKETQL